MIQGYVVWLIWPLAASLVIILEIRRRRGRGHTAVVLLLVSYALWVASVAFFPMPLPGDGEYWGRSFALNLVPFRNIVGLFSDPDTTMVIRLHGGNFLLLAPFTLLGPALQPRLRRWWKALVLGFGASVAIESTQLALCEIVGEQYRSVDIDDVILNTAGAVFGYGLFVLWRRWAARRQSPLGVT